LLSREINTVPVSRDNATTTPVAVEVPVWPVTATVAEEQTVSTDNTAAGPVVVEVVDAAGQVTIHAFSTDEPVVFSVDGPSTSNMQCAQESIVSVCPVIGNDKTSRELCENGSPLQISFSEFVPMPHLNRPNTGNRKCPAGHATVLTSTPYKQQLEESKINTKHDRNVTRPKASAKKQLSFKQKAKQSGKQNAKKKSKRPLANDHEADATKCLYCAELWRESVGKWIKCQGPCGEWAHTACAGVMPKEKNFECELCHE